MEKVSQKRQKDNVGEAAVIFDWGDHSRTHREDKKTFRGVGLKKKWVGFWQAEAEEGFPGGSVPTRVEIRNQDVFKETE